jgi:hypothetical protein
VRRWGDGFVVHDGGEAMTAFHRHGRDDAAIEGALKQAANRYSLDLEDGILTAKAHEAEWLLAAVLSIANASTMASTKAVETVIAKHERELQDRIYNEIKKAVPEQRIARQYHYRGASGREWPIDFAIIADRGPVLLKAVTPHPNSISASYTAFSDIGANDNVPLLAVHDRVLSPENQALMRKVAQLVPLPSAEAAVRRAAGNALTHG